MLIKGAKVSDYNGRTLSVLANSTVQKDPDIPEAHSLKGWFETEGCLSEFNNISVVNVQNAISGVGASSLWKCLEQIRNEHIGMNDKADYITVTAMITNIKKETALYMACPTQNCNKKVVDLKDGNYKCEKCNQEFSYFKWCMILHVITK